MSVRIVRPKEEVQYHKALRMPLYRPIEEIYGDFVSVEFKGMSWGKLFLMASGVKHNLITWESFEEIPSENQPKLLPPNSPIFASTGHKMEYLGYCDLKFKIDGHSFTDRFYVLDDLPENILGYGFMAKFKISIHCSKEKGVEFSFGEQLLKTYDINGQNMCHYCHRRSKQMY